MLKARMDLCNCTFRWLQRYKLPGVGAVGVTAWGGGGVRGEISEEVTLELRPEDGVGLDYMSSAALFCTHELPSPVPGAGNEP